MAVLVVLGFLGAILEGIGVNAAIPLLSFLLDNDTVPTDPISETIQAVFSAFSIDFSLPFLLGFVVALFLARALALAAFGYIRGWIGADFLYHETKETLHRIFRGAWPFLLTQKLGVVHTIAIRDIQRSSSLLFAVSQIIQSFTGFSIYLLVALNISPSMTLYTLVGGGVLLLVVRPFLSRTRIVSEDIVTTEKEISQFITEHIVGMKSLKASGTEKNAFAEGEKLISSLRSLQVRMAKILSLNTSMFQPFTLLFIILLFLLTYQTPGFNLVSFAATLYLIQKIFTYLESGQGALHVLGEMTPYAEHLLAFKAKLAKHAEEGAAGRHSFSFLSTLTFDAVSFSYGETGPVLENISFTIARGDTVAFIGPSGAGKTSVVDLLLRLFNPTEGSVRVDGISAEDIGLDEWRTHFGYVSQDVFLFNGTIEENIRFYRDNLSRTDIEKAAREANIHDFIVQLPHGYQTTTGDRGVMLSGGQRQRVALARALAGKPEILVLDEATSALDRESEKLVHEAISNLHGQVTVVIVAHRLSTVEKADTIFILDKGKIVEQGAPEELLNNQNSYFSKHYQKES